jgi:ATP synthase protein I
MARQIPPSADTGDSPQGDPWHAVGYITSGVFFYGAIGWALDRWLGTSFLVMVGILAGAGLGLYLTWVRFRPRDGGPDRSDGSPQEHRVP